MSEQLVTTKELAAWLHVSTAYVYENADELGVLRLGSGPRARLRFDVEEVKRRISCLAGRGSTAADPAPIAAKRPGRRRRTGTNVELLPIRGRREAP